MTKQLPKPQLEQLHKQFRREPKFRYELKYDWWRKILVADGSEVAGRCNDCDKSCDLYFEIPPSLASDE